MKDRLCLNYNYIFGDHMATCSHQAKLYYIKLMFFATNGFVSNPIEVLDSLGFDKGVYYELVANDEILTLPGRSEVFISAYFIHTHFNAASWLNSPYAIYWKPHLRTKPNGVATFNKPPEEPADDPETTKASEEKERALNNLMKQVKVKTDRNSSSWDDMLDDMDNNK